MTGFEPRTSGIGSDRSANCVTTTAPLANMFAPSNKVKSWLLVIQIRYELKIEG